MCVWFNLINIHRKIRYCNQLWVNPKSSAARLEFHQLPIPYPWLCALGFQFESNPKLKDRASSSAGNWLGMRDTWGHLSCCTLHEEYWTGVTLDTIQCNQCVQCVLIVTRTLLESFLKLGLLEPFYVLFWDTVLLYSSLGTPYLERLHWHRHPTPSASSCKRISDKEGSSSDSASALHILYTCSSAVHWDWVHPIHLTFLVCTPMAVSGANKRLAPELKAERVKWPAVQHKSSGNFCGDWDIDLCVWFSTLTFLWIFRQQIDLYNSLPNTCFPMCVT